MKKILIVVFLSIIVSCATTQQAKPDEYAHITIPKIQDSCVPTESYHVSVVGMSGMVIVFDNCLKINKLLIVLFNKDVYNQKIRQVSANLISLHYIKYLNEKNNGEAQHSLKLIRSGVHEQNWTIMYETIQKKITCTSSGCKSNDTPK